MTITNQSWLFDNGEHAKLYRENSREQHKAALYLCLNTAYLLDKGVSVPSIEADEHIPLWDFERDALIKVYQKNTINSHVMLKMLIAL